MGLFSGVKTLFQGAANLFKGQPQNIPTQEQLFSGDPGAFGHSTMIAPGQAAPSFSVGVNRPLNGPDGQPINAPRKEGPLHVYTFSSLWNSASKTYSWRWDEAYKRCREDALAMRRDCFLMSLLFERKYPTAQMPWHLEPDDKKNAGQMRVADYLKSCVETLPNIQEASMTALEALWYGRAGGQMTWTQKTVHGMVSFVPENVVPVNGDKIQFTWDGVPQIRLYGGVDKLSPGESLDVLTKIMDDRFGIPREDLAFTDRGVMLELRRPFWRDRFIIHKHDLIDADFYESDMAGGIHGVGIRHWIYWFDWIKKEIASYILDFLERTGQGFTVYYYDPGNPQDKANVEQIAKQQGRNTWIVWPRAPGSEGAQKGVERVEPNTAGASVLKDLLGYYDGYIERFIVGQSMSGGADNESGLGGTGRANFARQTKSYIVRNDCMKLAGTWSTDLIKPIIRCNRGNCERIYGKPLDFEVRWKYDIDADDPKAKLDAGKLLFDMGVTLKEDELRSVGGFEKPSADDKVVGGQPQGPGGAPGAPQPGQHGAPGAPGQPAPGKQLFGGAQLQGAPGGLETGTPEKEKEREESVRYEWEAEAERYGVDPRKMTALAEAIRDDLLRYEGGAWITVGGHEEGGKKHVDGQPVKVEWLEKWKKDAEAKKGGGVKKKSVAPDPPAKKAAADPVSREKRKTGLHPIRGLRQEVEGVLREHYGDKAKEMAAEVGLSLNFDSVRAAAVKHGNETSANNDDVEKLRNKVGGILKKIGERLKERDLPSPPEDWLGAPKPFRWADRDKTDEEKEKKLKREAVAERKRYAEEHWKNPPEAHTVEAEQWAALAMYRQMQEAKKDQKKLAELKALQDDLNKIGDDWYEKKYNSAEERQALLNKLNAADEVWDKVKNKPANKKLFKKYRPGWYDKKDIPDARDAFRKSEDIIKRFDEDWAIEDYIPATDAHTQALQDHRSAVKQALDEGKDIPLKIIGDFRYEDWLPKKYKEEFVTEANVEVHGLYMKHSHEYYNALASAAMKHAEPEVDELIKIAGDPPDFKAERESRELERKNKFHAAYMAQRAFEDKWTEKDDDTGEMIMRVPPEHQKEYDALIEAQIKAQRRMLDFNEDANVVAEKKAASDWLDKLLPKGGNKGAKIEEQDFLTAESKSELKKANDFIQKIFDSSWGDMPSKLKQLPPGVKRAFQRGDETHVPAEEEAWTFVHEFGHRVEHMNSDTLGALSRAFAMQKVKESGEEVKRLGSWYEAHEIGSQDGFRDRYIGKFYNHDSSEVLSMGIQYLYQDPVAFFREDPKHFKWTLAAIHGLLT